MASLRARCSWLIGAALVAACSGTESNPSENIADSDESSEDDEAGHNGLDETGGAGGDGSPSPVAGAGGDESPGNGAGAGGTASTGGSAGSAGGAAGAGGSDTGQVIEGPGLGMPPTLPPNASNPLKDIPAAARVLPGWSASHVENLSWQPPNHLYVTAIQGAYQTKVAGGDSTFPYLHPFRVWRLTESSDKSVMNEHFRFPTSPEIEETAWCNWGKVANAFWCYSHQQKTNKFVLRIPSPGDAPGPFELNSLAGAQKWSVPGSHSRMIDAVELANGRVYWTRKAGTNPSITRIFTSDPGAPAPEFFKEVLAGTAEMEDPFGLATSPDGKTLYFTVAGMGTGKGSLWSAQIQPTGELAAPRRLVANIDKPRRMACDEFGNLYVASGSEVRVYASNGAEFGRITMVTDQASKNAIDQGKGKITLLAVTFGGPAGNLLYASLGADLGFSTLKDAKVSFGALFRVPVAARGADFAK